MPASAAETTLELQVGELKQLFNAMDPAPFRERDLDPNAEAYIVEWAQEVARGAPLALAVRLVREPATAASATVLRDAVHAYFQQRALATRGKLRRLLRVGRVSLVIGLVFLAFAIMLGGFLAGFATSERYGIVIEETFIIGGWVALWRPLEIFLYDWWPLLSEARLYDRLGRMRVELAGAVREG